MAAGDNPIPVNRNLPPFGRSIAAGGIVSQAPNETLIVQHPNPNHLPRGAASPFAGVAGSANGVRGNPRRRPPHSAPGGIHQPTRK